MMSRIPIRCGFWLPALLGALVFLIGASLAEAAAPSAVVKSGDVQAQIALKSATVSAAHPVGVTVDIAIGPGWHIYGNPVPQEFVPTSVTFSKAAVAAQKIDFPPPTPVEFKGLGETLPVYEKSVRAAGTIDISPALKPGNYQLAGTFKFQECNDNICRIPKAVNFAIPVTVVAK